MAQNRSVGAGICSSGKVDGLVHVYLGGMGYDIKCGKALGKVLSRLENLWQGRPQNAAKPDKSATTLRQRVIGNPSPVTCNVSQIFKSTIKRCRTLFCREGCG